MSAGIHAAASPRKAPAPFADEREAQELGPLLERLTPLTTTPTEAMIDLARLVQAILRFNIPGDFVECGCYAGGAGFLMAHVLREAGVRDRKVWMFDSFEGLPSPQEIDGRIARDYAANPDASDYLDNCRASYEEVLRNAGELGLREHVECVKGWFEDSLPVCRESIGPIALLRLDGNWYASMRCCLDNLFDQVVDDGFVICHTYYQYDGASSAVHEFLGERKLPYRIENVSGVRPDEMIEDYQTALFHKGETTWKWLRQVWLATRATEQTVPPGGSFIWVDQQELGAVFQDGRRALPFLEADGEYNGTPEDDAEAIRELERMRQAGAEHLAFAWPAFWWLEYYADFHAYLRAHYPCVWENGRVVVFDLRPQA